METRYCIKCETETLHYNIEEKDTEHVFQCSICKTQSIEQRNLVIAKKSFSAMTPAEQDEYFFSDFSPKNRKGN